MGGASLRPMSSVASISRGGVNDPELGRELLGCDADVDENGVPTPRRRVHGRPGASPLATSCRRTSSIATDGSFASTMDCGESSSLRRSSFRETRVDIIGNHNLNDDALTAIRSLRELRHCRVLEIMKPSHLNRHDLYFLSPTSMSGERMMPSILKVCTADDAQREAAISLENARHLGGYVAQLADAVYFDDVGLLQLRLPGGVGLLPDEKAIKDSLAEYSDKLEQVLHLACEGQTEPFDEFMTHTFSLFDDGLRPCAAQNFKYGQKTSLLKLFDGDKVRKLLLGSDPEYSWGPDFFDGFLEMEDRGGLADATSPSHGANALQEVVGFIAGRRQPPSEYFSAFFEAADKAQNSKVMVRYPTTLVHNGLPLRSVVADSSDMLWILDMESFGTGHLFADLADKIARCLFEHVCALTTEEDDVNLRRLLQSLAALPGSVRESVFPHCPDNATHIMHCVWTFCAQMYCHYINFARIAQEAVDLAGRQYTDGAATPRSSAESDKFHLQILWSLFTSTVQMVVAQENRRYPMFKRYALFFSLSLAVRLQVELTNKKPPQWLQAHYALWSSFHDDDNGSGSIDRGSEVIQVRSACARRIMAVALSRESWIRDPISLQTWNVMQVVLPIKIQERDIYRTDYRGVAQALIRRKRLMIVGDAGSGKTVLTKQCIVHLLSEEEIGQAPRIPVRISLVLLGHLQARTEQDVLGAYIHEEYTENVAMAIEEARHSLGLLLIFEELDAADPRKFWVFYYLKELYDKEPQHLVLLTTGPGPLEIRSNSRRRYENLVSAWWKQSLYWGFAVCLVQPLNDEHIVEICENRLDPNVAAKVSTELLQRPMRSLVQTPLQLSLAIPYVSRHVASTEGQCYATCSDIYAFALQHLIRHVESAQRRLQPDQAIEDNGQSLEEMLMELAYKKQYECESTIYQRDLSHSAAGSLLWKLARSQQLPLFDSITGRDHIRFFHQTMQEYLAAMYALSLWEKGSLPGWLLKKADDNVYEIGVHRFFGDLALQRGLCFTEDQHEHFHRSGRKKRFQADLVWLITRTFARGDRLATEGLFKLLSIIRPLVLSLDFNECLLRDVRTLSLGLSHLVHVEQLTISFEWCNVLPSLAGLGEGLAFLNNLRILELDLTGCLNLRGLEGFGEGLCALHELRCLTLDFTGCTSLESVREIGRGLFGLLKLMCLRLVFKDCVNLESVDSLGASLGSLTCLNMFTLDIMGCSKLTSLGQVGKSLEQLSNLRSISINILHTQKLHGVTEFCSILGKMSNLRLISLDRKAAWIFLCPSALLRGRTSCRHLAATAAGCCMLWAHMLAEWTRIFLYWCFWRFAKVCAACC
mmetsp:Transcript_12218/g.27663  ORF Transcript_12218/g.27663 Transcript_12218/m.27663 type:complete len:1327 (-) Transcript_12218:92-4072(-)